MHMYIHTHCEFVFSYLITDSVTDGFDCVDD